MTKPEQIAALKALPAVGELLNDAVIKPLLERYPRSLVVTALREQIDQERAAILAGKCESFDMPAFLAALNERVTGLDRPNLRRLINATGVVVHTNLGRSPLADPAIEAVNLAARGYSNLEYDLAAGKRGSRFSLVADLLCELTGAEAALVVNNNAGATLLALNTLAQGREVIVSRGELIEIGGSFRIPDVMTASGATLVEVGTTNRTHLRDYENAIGERTAMLMKVHTSNYRIVGFTNVPTGADLVELAHRHGLVAIEDLGSGSLINSTRFSLPPEPTAPEVIAHGLDLVTFSGDKLLGGPQGGILVGKADLVEACAKNPLHRALRVDKMTLAALEATLRLYRDPETAIAQVPTLRMLASDTAKLAGKAERLAERLTQSLGDAATVEITESVGRVGGGALPMVDLKGPVVAITPHRVSIAEATASLRALDTPVIVRVEDDRIIADPRTILDGDEELFHNGLVEVLSIDREQA